MATNLDAPDYLQLLAGGTRWRMMRLYDRMTAHNINRPPSAQWSSWRDARSYGFHSWTDNCGALSQGFDTENIGTRWEKKTPIWYCHTGEQFRNERDAHETEGARIKHTGWYSDACHDETIVGIVGMLPHGRFLAGYRMTVNDQRTYIGHAYDDECEAAHAADDAAKKMAEIERNHHVRWIQVGDLRDTIAGEIARLKECLALRNNPDFDLRSEVPELVASIRANRRKLIEDYSDVER